MEQNFDILKNLYICENINKDNNIWENNTQEFKMMTPEKFTREKITMKNKNQENIAYKLRYSYFISTIDI